MISPITQKNITSDSAEYNEMESMTLIDNNTEVSKRLARCVQDALSILDLSLLQVSSIPMDRQFPHVTHLIMTDHRLTEFPDLWAFPNLKHIDLSNGSIKKIADDRLIFPQLQTIVLKANYISALPKSFFSLLSLQEFDISQNKIKEITDQFSELINLKILVLDNNQISTLPDALFHLPLVSLSVNSNRIRFIPDSIRLCGTLKKIYMQDNFITRIPASIALLDNLEQINLAKNKISRIPRSIRFMKSINFLGLQGNCLTHFPDSFLIDGKTMNVDLSETPLIPSSEQAMPIEQLVEHFANSSSIVFHRREGRLVLVGGGEVGKTTLKNIIVHDQQLNPAEQTRGVEIDMLAFPSIEQAPDSFPLDVDVWDFGGQVIYDSIHSVYIAPRAVYILLYDTRKGTDHGRIEHWLQTLHILAPNSSVFLLENQHGDDRIYIPVESIEKKFPNLRGFYRIRLVPDTRSRCISENLPISQCGCDSCHAITEFIKVIRAEFDRTDSNSPVQVVEWTEKALAWLGQLEILSIKEPCPLRREDEIVSALQSIYGDPIGIRQFLKKLHNLGHILYYSDESKLAGSIVLRPSWVKDALYKLVDSASLEQQNGIITGDYLLNVWEIMGDAYPKHALPYILDLLEKYCLAFKTDNGHKYIFPSYITHHRHPETLLFDTLPISLYISFKQPINQSLLSIFFVKMHTYILVKDGLPCMWRKGVALFDSEGKTEALIEVQNGDRELRVSIDGSDRRKLLSEIRANLASAYRFMTHTELYEEFAPCTCTACRTSKNPARYRLKWLYDLLDARKFQTVCTENARCMVEVMDVINGIEKINPDIYEATIKAKKISKKYTQIALSTATITVILLLLIGFTNTSSPILDAAAIIAALFSLYGANKLFDKELVEQWILGLLLRRQQLSNSQKKTPHGTSV